MNCMYVTATIMVIVLIIHIVITVKSYIRVRIILYVS